MDAYNHAFERRFDPKKEAAYALVQFTFIKVARFFTFKDDLTFSEDTEVDILHIWENLTSVFDGLSIVAHL